MDKTAPSLENVTADVASASTAADGAGRCVSRIAVRSRDRIVSVPTADIVRVEAEGNHVRLWTRERCWLHKETLTGLLDRLDPGDFVRIHRSHAVSVGAVTELVPRSHGEFRVKLVNGSEITSGRGYRDALRHAFAIE
jgi:two-component system LytT family response regulator